MNDPLPRADAVLPDEDTLRIPDAWREVLHPRRGGAAPSPAVELDPAAPGELRARTAEARPLLERVLGHERSAPDLVEAARAYLAGKADPVGAAVVTLIVRSRRVDGRHPAITTCVDAWTAEHGLAFAACACAELDQVYPRFYDVEGGAPVTANTWASIHWAEGETGRRMRALLAAAGDADYAEAVERLADHRRTPMQRAAVSFLVPTRQDWVDECCAAPPVHGTYRTYGTSGALALWCSLGSAEQIARLGDQAELGNLERSLGVLATVAEGVGPAIAPLLARTLDEESEASNRGALLDVLGALPTDEAFRLVGERLNQQMVLVEAEAMIERFPVRALRLLPPLTTDTSRRARLASGLLNAHLAARPELLAAALPGLPDEARSIVEDAWRARADEAPERDVPKALVAAKRKAPPAWAAPGALPQVLLRGRERALPAEAIGHLVTALAKAGPRRAPAAPVAAALEACDPRSLAEFGWALFERWRLSGEQPTIGWPVGQLRWTGDDETARRLGSMVRSWPGQGAIKVALGGVDALTAIGSDLALVQLHGISEKARPKRLKDRARQALGEAAAERGLSRKQLADRLVPGFGPAPGGA
ncbi:hypothetical protein [Actinomadura xylanilytica]|uniref:hypothetical protein n=1 Tax=Actinomadura xylanilytica TaxID=887459 RepID=UPI00255B2127|nr:hypothetical protein [Actinomadura xylanilytica]MDL4775377.1 hypothetical protein [Actinomadura xylanilytica]